MSPKRGLFILLCIVASCLMFLHFFASNGGSQHLATENSPAHTSSTTTTDVSRDVVPTTDHLQTTVAATAITQQIAGFVETYYSRDASLSAEQQFNRLLGYALPNVASVQTFQLGDTVADQAIKNGKVYKAQLKRGSTGAVDPIDGSASIAVTVMMSSKEQTASNFTDTGQFQRQLSIVLVGDKWFVSAVEDG